MLKLIDLHLSFPHKPRVLDGISVDLAPGQVVGIVAPNGMGKTTLFNVILNNLTPSLGHVELDERIYHSARSTQAIHRQVCAFPLESELFGELSGRAHLQLFADMWGNTRKPIATIIDTLQMGQYVDHPTKTYSLGMKQRLCFAMLVAADAPVLLLDEIMNGLDPLNVELITSVIRALRAEGKLLITISHLLGNLESFADQIYFLKAGHFVQHFDLTQPRPLFLKLRGALPAAPVFTAAPVTHYPGDLTLIPLTAPHADQMAQALVQAGQPFECAAITLEEEFARWFSAAADAAPGTGDSGAAAAAASD